MAMMNKDPNDFMFHVDLRKYLDVIARQKAFIIVFSLAAIVASTLLTYAVSERYDTETTIFYRPQESSLLRQKNTEAFGAPVPNAPFKVIQQTLRDIVKSEVILRPLVQELGLDAEESTQESIWYRRQFQNAREAVHNALSNTWMLLKYGRMIDEDPTDRAINRLRENLDIRATKDSYVYVLKVRDKDAERAARTVDAIGSALVHWLKAQDQNPAERRTLQLETQLAEKEGQITRLHEQRQDLLNAYNVVSVSEEREEGVRNVYALEEENAQLNAQIAAKQRKIASLEKEMQKKKKGYIQPQDYKRMASEKLFEEVELQGLLARVASIRSSMLAMKGKLLDMPTLQKELDELNLKIEAGTREYQHLKDLYLEASAQALSPEVETRVLHAAVVPAKPVYPIKIYHVGSTAFLSLLLSMGLVYMLAYFNIRIFFASQGLKGRRGTDGNFELENTHYVR
jgi:uncharacterized protein involved in exopolysaccharide biosynthesis